MNQDIIFCDHCGLETSEDMAYIYSELPFDIASANKGESGIVCVTCDEILCRTIEPHDE